MNAQSLDSENLFLRNILVHSRLEISLPAASFLVIRGNRIQWNGSTTNQNNLPSKS